MNRGKLCILLGLGFLALYLVVASGALTQLVFNRTSAAGSAADDATGALTLSNFNNPTIALTTTYKQTGTVTNRSTQALSLTIYIDPIILKTKSNATWTYYVQIRNGTTTLDTISFTGKNAQDPAEDYSIVLTIQPGATFTTWEKLSLSKTGSFTSRTYFRFSASSATGISMDIRDTTAVPRRHSYTG